MKITMKLTGKEGSIIVNMKKKLSMMAAAALTIIIAGFSAVMPAFADSGINSSGAAVLNDGDVAFYSEDIAKLQAQADALSVGLPEISFASADGKALRDELESKGNINYDSGKVVFDSSDLVKLADGIDKLDMGYKYEAVDALNKIGTYHTQAGAVTHNPMDEILLPEYASKLTFTQICEGILKSQSVDHLAGEGILPAIENNLSEGSAAWVDGKLLIGNGKDNEDSYNQGYEDGYAEGENQTAVACYFLGEARNGVIGGGLYYEIASQVPMVDYTKLTKENFIVCPYKIRSGSNSLSQYLSVASNVTTFCTINETEMDIVTEYDANTGRFYVSDFEISAKGGISSKSGYSRTATAPVSFYTYLIVGEIVDRKLPDIGDIQHAY